MRLVVGFWNDENGATAIEYGIIGSLVVFAIILALTQFSTSLNTTFTSVANHI